MRVVPLSPPPPKRPRSWHQSLPSRYVLAQVLALFIDDRPQSKEKGSLRTNVAVKINEMTPNVVTKKRRISPDDEISHAYVILSLKHGRVC